MEFKLDQKQIQIQKRTSIIATIFIIVITVIGAIGIIGPDPSLERIVLSIIFVSFFGFVLNTKENLLRVSL